MMVFWLKVVALVFGIVVVLWWIHGCGEPIVNLIALLAAIAVFFLTKRREEYEVGYSGFAGLFIWLLCIVLGVCWMIGLTAIGLNPLLEIVTLVVAIIIVVLVAF